MLRILRKNAKQRRLWVDALCLNQKDNQEKSIQVQQMGQIYHMADKVHIWLGPAVANTTLVFSFLRALVVRFEPTPGQARDPTTEEILYTFEEIFKHRNIQPVLDLLENSWFSRRWTLQEGFLERDSVVRCGSSRISWPWFTEGLKLIHKRSQELQGIQNSHSALYALNVLQVLQRPGDLLSLIWTFHMSQCSDHRDRIYSLLGLAQNIDREAPASRTVNSDFEFGKSSNQELPIPDYGLSIDAVFREFASHCISTGRLLEILLHIDGFGRLSEANPKWPSWVPNWTRARDRKPHSPTAISKIVSPFQSIDRSPLLTSLHGIDVNLVDCFCPQPIWYSNSNHHGLLIYGDSILKTVKVCDIWPGSNDSDHMAKYLNDWIHQETILHLPDGCLSSFWMEDEVAERLLYLVAGSEFFGYAKHMSVRAGMNTKPPDKRPGQGGVEILGRCSPRWLKGIANILYPIKTGKGFYEYTMEQILRKEHLDTNHQRNPPPTAECRQALSYFLEDVSRMMQEGKKRLVVADGPQSFNMRRHWIAPSDVRMGDMIIDISDCGNIGTLLRPMNSPSELHGRPTFQLIGIVWSLDDNDKELHCDDGGGKFLIL